MLRSLSSSWSSSEGGTEVPRWISAFKMQDVFNHWCEAHQTHWFDRYPCSRQCEMPEEHFWGVCSCLIQWPNPQQAFSTHPQSNQEVNMVPQSQLQEGCSWAVSVAWAGVQGHCKDLQRDFGGAWIMHVYNLSVYICLPSNNACSPCRR